MIDNIPDEIVEKIKEHYDKGQGSIQDIARVYRLNVDEVLAIVDNSDISTVEAIGDLIDQEEAGKSVELQTGKEFDVPFDVS